MPIKMTLLLYTLFLSVSVNATTCPSLLKHKMTMLRSEKTVDFCESYMGKPILAVNTASNCGFTPQFEGLEKLHQKFKSQGLIVIGFPSNSFNQEFDDEKKTAEVCYINYGVSFPMFSTSPVIGDGANQFFRTLSAITGVSPKWNFYKYLIDVDGETVSVFSNFTKPIELEKEIDRLIKKNIK